MTVKELTLTDNYEIVHLGDPEMHRLLLPGALL